jgi:hypothetical protein
VAWKNRLSKKANTTATLRRTFAKANFLTPASGVEKQPIAARSRDGETEIRPKFRQYVDSNF